MVDEDFDLQDLLTPLAQPAFRPIHTSNSSASLNPNCAINLTKDLSMDPDEMMVDAQSINVEIEDSEEEEDDNDGSKSTNLILYVTDDPDKNWPLIRQNFPSKAGGAPAWLDPVNIPTGRSSTCDICGLPLRFLLQLEAPLRYSKESAYYRMLFVFVCTSLGCLVQHQRNCYQKNPSRSVKVFRCQLPRVNPFYSDVGNGDGSAEVLCDGVRLCDWCGAWKADRQCSSCRAGCYCSDVHRAECCATDDREIKVLWQEKEIVEEYDETEPKEDSHRDKIESCVPDDGLDDESTEAFMDALEGNDATKSWDAFLERVRSDPEQVLRYWRSPEAKPLWALASGRPSKSDIPNCNYCGGELAFEFQIMPQLLYYLKVENDDDSIDFGTIAVYTCQDSCDGGHSYKDEFAWAQPSFEPKVKDGVTICPSSEQTPEEYTL